ncbi:MAG: ArnT family glycosyltransferase [Terriglobales bacterium]|jgi:hypothetical protein
MEEQRSYFWSGRPWIWMMVLAWLLRAWFIVHWSVYGNVEANHFAFGIETGSIGNSIYSGEGFSSPFEYATGPTAWVAPGYPYLIALAFKIFGPYSLGAWNFMLFLNSAFAAATCIPLYRLGNALGSYRSGLWAGWIWAAGLPFFPYAIWWVWEVAISAFLITYLLWFAIVLAREPSLKRWSWFAVVWGLGSLTNPAILSVAPVLIGWPLLRNMKAGSDWKRPLVIFCLIVAIFVGPWMVRNYEVFGQPVFLRGNFWFEFWLGNSPMKLGFEEAWKHPTLNPEEMREYVRLGEVQYVKSKREAALAWVKSDLAGFAELTAKRVWQYWMGGKPVYGKNTPPWKSPNLVYPALSILAWCGVVLAWRRKREIGWPMLGVMLLYPTVYYLTYANPRYRHPLEPMLILLATYFVCEARAGNKSKSDISSSTNATSAAVS